MRDHGVAKPRVWQVRQHRGLAVLAQGSESEVLRPSAPVIKGNAGKWFAVENGSFLTVAAYRAHGNSPGLSGGKEVADRRGNLAGVCLKRKVAGVEKAHDGVRDIARECFGALRQEKRVVA